MLNGALTNGAIMVDVSSTYQVGRCHSLVVVVVVVVGVAVAASSSSSPRPQLDPLEDKSPPWPNQLRLKIASCHHVDDWGVDGEDCAPSPAPSPPQAKRRREEREWGMDRMRAPDL